MLHWKFRSKNENFDILNLGVLSHKKYSCSNHELWKSKNILQIYPLCSPPLKPPAKIVKVRMSFCAIKDFFKLLTRFFVTYPHFLQLTQPKGKNYFLLYCKYYSQGIIVFLVSNRHVEIELLTDYYWVWHYYLYTDTFH